MRVYYTYVLASISRRLYTGVAGDLRGRIWRHEFDTGQSFTRRYHINRLVHYEAFGNVRLAIEREKDIERRDRSFRVRLIEKHNPDWLDLAAFWFD